MNFSLRTHVVPAVVGLNLITGMTPAHAATALTWEEKGFAVGAASGAICYVNKGQSTEVMGEHLESVISDEQFAFLESDDGKAALTVVLPYVNDDCNEFDVDEETLGIALAPYIF